MKVSGINVGLRNKVEKTRMRKSETMLTGCVLKCQQSPACFTGIPTFLVLADLYPVEATFTLKQTQCLSYKRLHNRNDSLTYVVYLSYQKEDEEISQGPKNPLRMFCH